MNDTRERPLFVYLNRISERHFLIVDSTSCFNKNMLNLSSSALILQETPQMVDSQT